jgi:hypothetical protein
MKLRAFEAKLKIIIQFCQRMFLIQTILIGFAFSSSVVPNIENKIKVKIHFLNSVTNFNSNEYFEKK